MLRDEGGVEVPVKSCLELFRIRLLEGTVIAYRSGSVVFQEDLGDVISRVVREGGLRVGVDEVGKGEAKGPIVVAAVALDGDGREKMVSIGLVETKSARPGRISKMARGVEKGATCIEIIIVPPDEFRRIWKRGNLNELLAEWHKQALRGVADCLEHAKEVIIDSFDDRRLNEALGPIATELEANLLLENRADEKYLEVAAASVIARAKREELIARGMDGRKW